ncbi:hypothetical protein Tco_1432546 [Tanacetum coccineum]
MEVDDQVIQTILLSLPGDIYAAVDSCETGQAIWLRVQQMMKGSNIRIQEKKAKLFNEWERFTSTNGESIKSYYHRKRGFHPKRLVVVHNPNYTNDQNLLVSTKPLPSTVQPVQSGKQDVISDPICSTYTHYYMESYPGLLAYAQTTPKLQRFKYVELDPVE